MIFKDERQNPVKKNLRLATASSASGPYGEVSEPFTRDWVEGPSAIRIGSEWVVYYDRYRERRYGAVKSKDLRSWTDISDQLSFPADHRHGSVIEVAKNLAERLRAINQ